MFPDNGASRSEETIDCAPGESPPQASKQRSRRKQAGRSTRRAAVLAPTEQERATTRMPMIAACNGCPARCSRFHNQRNAYLEGGSSGQRVKAQTAAMMRSLTCSEGVERYRVGCRTIMARSERGSGLTGVFLVTRSAERSGVPSACKLLGQKLAFTRTTIAMRKVPCRRSRRRPNLRCQAKIIVPTVKSPPAGLKVARFSIPSPSAPARRIHSRALIVRSTNRKRR